MDKKIKKKLPVSTDSNGFLGNSYQSSPQLQL